jgi:sensor histidine kinase YesM
MEGYISQLLNVRLSEGNRYFHRLAERVYNARLYTLLALVLISLLCFGFAMVFSNSLTSPIRKLAAAAGRMSGGDLEVAPVVVAAKDEIGVLARSFNTMSSSIKDMVKGLQEKAVLEKKLHEEELVNLSMQRSLREAQFLSLQAQINPHFLFNTLNTISRTAAFEGADATAALIGSLSHLFRYSLRGHGRSVKLGEELEIVREYLRIQEKRFGDRIRTLISCAIDPDLAEIPCFTLQPLVENSLLHGLEPKEAGGTLRVKISSFQGRIRIRILDTGLGMTKRKIAEIFSSREDLFRGDVKSIGILNVATRLGLFFNGEEEFFLHSRPGRGTLVWISFPDRKGNANV